MEIRPLHDRVIVKRLAAERTTSSGIVIPESAGDKPDQGEVIAVGPGRRDDQGKLIPMGVKVGDKVQAKIIGIDFDKKRVSLSIRALLEPAADEAEDAEAEETEAE